MRRAGRLLLHATLLGALVAGTAYGIVMLAGYAVMVVQVVAGMMPAEELTPKSVTFGVLMVTLWGGVIVAGLAALWRQCRRSVALARWVAGTGGVPSPRLAAAVAQAGCQRRVVEVPDATAYAFTHGIWHPRVVISAGLVEQANHAELVAVLRHEDFHVENRDPLRVLALRTWSAAFFFIPVIGALLQRLLDRQELRADRAAIGACGVPPVAGALLKAVGEPKAAPGTALAAMGGPALLEARVTQLETGQRPPVLAAAHPVALLASAPGLGLVAIYGVLLYQVCMAVQLCCLA